MNFIKKERKKEKCKITQTYNTLFLSFMWVKEKSEYFLNENHRD